MRFDLPQILWLLPVATVLLVLLHAWAGRRRRALIARFGNPATIGKLTRGVSVARRRARFALLLVAVLLVIIAVARPQYGVIERPVSRSGVELVVAIDCSNSMLARDIQPNRLQRARDQLRNLILRLKGDGVAVVAFAGMAVIQCPMTSDYGMALNLLDSINTDSVPIQGTNIAAAIDTSLRAFQRSRPGGKVIVLLTDGESHAGDALEAAQRAREAGVRIFSVGIGSTEGVPIPLPEGGYKESAGAKVSTRLDFDTLTQIALATGGQAILANPSGDIEIETIYNETEALEREEFQAKTMIVRRERFQPLLVAALLILTVESLIGDRKRRVEAGGVGRFD
jgi:Ca-activated chloride channel family protein